MCSGGLNFETVPSVSALALPLRSVKKALFSILSGGPASHSGVTFHCRFTDGPTRPPGGHFVGSQLVETVKRLTLIVTMMVKFYD